MKHFRKTLFLLATFIFLLIPGLDSAAKSNTPGNVSKLTAKALSDTSVKLTWSKASNATQYRVFLVNQETGTVIKRVASTSKTTYTLKDLETEQTLCWQVYAYRKVSGKYYQSEQGSPLATVTLTVYTPGKVSKLRKTGVGDCSVILKWNAASNATGYQVFQYDSSTDTYKKIATTEDTYRKITGMTAGEKYTFAVRAYRKIQGTVRYGKYSDTLTITAKSKDLSAIRGRTFVATVKSSVKATVVSTGKKITVKKGKTVYATSNKSSGEITAEYNGVEIKIDASKLSYGNLYVKTSVNYTKSQKETFVNAKGYSSPTSYLIWINQYTLTVTVFKGSVGEWKQVRSMICCVGSRGHTGVGVYKLLKRDTYRGKPRIFFTWNTKMGKGNSFHCRIDSNTRAAVSGGCIRLSDSDLAYIAKLPLSTTVVSY